MLDDVSVRGSHGRGDALGCRNAYMNASKSGRPMIAVVDDDEFICRAVRRLVMTRGIRAQTFTYSRTFVDLLDADPSFQPHCVVLDLQMPGLDGFEVQKRLASSRPGVPVIFLTARYHGPERDQALAAGAVALFRKPLYEDMDAFVDAVADAVKR